MADSTESVLYHLEKKTQDLIAEIRLMNEKIGRLESTFQEFRLDFSITKTKFLMLIAVLSFVLSVFVPMFMQWFSSRIINPKVTGSIFEIIKTVFLS